MADTPGLVPVGDETDGDFLIPDWDESLVGSNLDWDEMELGNPHEDDE